MGRTFVDAVFRGKLASASLKLGQRHRRVRDDGIEVFRGKLASASLKPRVDPDPFVRAIVFRGKLASASLKLLEVSCLLLFPRRIPRQACLGLIEAGPRRQHRQDGPRTGIPRQACLGLIEATYARFGLRAWRVFRGKLASASLKPRHHVVERHRHRVGIPRQACLGLIEAG